MNPTLLVDLINQAQGDRSLSCYAKECGISQSTLSRIKNNINDQVAKPETLKKLATYAHNNITYELLMTAAGHSEYDTNTKDEKIELVKLLDTLKNHPELITANGHSLPQEAIDCIKHALAFGVQYSKTNK